MHIKNLIRSALRLLRPSRRNKQYSMIVKSGDTYYCWLFSSTTDEADLLDCFKPIEDVRIVEIGSLRDEFTMENLERRVEILNRRELRD